MKRHTSQREALGRVFREADHPLTVVQILQRGRQSVPTLNQATVYRNLKLLTRDNIIRPLLHPILGMLYERADSCWKTATAFSPASVPCVPAARNKSRVIPLLFRRPGDTATLFPALSSTTVYM